MDPSLALGVVYVQRIAATSAQSPESEITVSPSSIAGSCFQAPAEDKGFK